MEPDSHYNGHIIDGKKNTLTIILEKRGNKAIQGRKIGQLKKAN